MPAFGDANAQAFFSRQVGAVILSSQGELIATGANEVPKAFGGQYFTEPSLSEEHDYRDYKLEYDSNAKFKNDVILELGDRLIQRQMLSKKWKNNIEGVWEEIESCLQRTPLSSLTAFGRAVHAEMEALLSCARIGVSPLGGNALYYDVPLP